MEKQIPGSDMPIIDAHAHVGKGLSTDLLVNMMKGRGIGLAVVSNISNDTQLELNEELVKILRNYKTLRGIAWCKPNQEGGTPEELEPFFRDRRLLGMKLHPSLDRYSVIHPCVVPYMELCRKYGLTVQCHTAPDEYCNPELMLELAGMNPDVKIVMVHMNLGNYAGDNEDAIEAAGKRENLYLDTSWVPCGNVLKAVRRIGHERVVFGTDAPLASYDAGNEGDHYDYYFQYNAYPLKAPSFMETLRKKLSTLEYEHIFCKNAQRLYGL